LRTWQLNTSDREHIITHLVWRKSSFSGGSGNGSCVEVAFGAVAVAVRDSKNPDGPTLDLATHAWHALLTAAKEDL
jgi:Domain of unknown function (DUF397)